MDVDTACEDPPPVLARRHGLDGLLENDEIAPVGERHASVRSGRDAGAEHGEPRDRRACEGAVTARRGRCPGLALLGRRPAAVALTRTEPMVTSPPKSETDPTVELAAAIARDPFVAEALVESEPTAIAPLP